MSSLLGLHQETPADGDMPRVRPDPHPRHVALPGSQCNGLRGGGSMLFGERVLYAAFLWPSVLILRHLVTHKVVCHSTPRGGCGGIAGTVTAATN